MSESDSIPKKLLSPQKSFLHFVRPAKHANKSNANAITTKLEWSFFIIYEMKSEEQQREQKKNCPAEGEEEEEMYFQCKTEEWLVEASRGGGQWLSAHKKMLKARENVIIILLKSICYCSPSQHKFISFLVIYFHAEIDSREWRQASEPINSSLKAVKWACKLNFYAPLFTTLLFQPIALNRLVVYHKAIEGEIFFAASGRFDLTCQQEWIEVILTTALSEHTCWMRKQKVTRGNCWPRLLPRLWSWMEFQRGHFEAFSEWNEINNWLPGHNWLHQITSTNIQLIGESSSHQMPQKAFSKYINKLFMGASNESAWFKSF